MLYEGFERPPTNDVRLSADSFFGVRRRPRGQPGGLQLQIRIHRLRPGQHTLDCNSLPQAQQTACRNKTLTKKDLIGTGTGRSSS
ncbi:MAG: hypothetical protein R2854_09680 [Caldilineaceae bacterium]